ncbi:type II secretion system F family protein [Agrobacterium sp. ES01]|uniref:type II secretion system F family protein n=1 Tax=Agrobacterium sp. ES01 TaxID=3420714 RepID=UPI003D0EB3A3
MFGFDPIILAIVALVAIAAGAAAYALMYARIEVERKTTNRIARVKSAETDRTKVKAARDRVQEISKRKKSVQDSINELERKQKEKSRKASNVSLKMRLVQSGLSISITTFYLMGVALGAGIFLVTLVFGAPLPIVAGAAAIAVLGVPRWVLSFLISRRKNLFLKEFPNSLDVMVRSIKSGLPLNDALRLIATEAQEPVRTEFRRVVESQQMGLSIPEACQRMATTMPLQEINFFAIVIAIQNQAGGNLSEALGNLSRVLRDRKKMRAKVSAMSMEAKASAAIIGILPFVVALLVYLTSPQYIMILFTDPRGHLILGCSAVWMSIGILVMRNMIQFDI